MTHWQYNLIKRFNDTCHILSSILNTVFTLKMIPVHYTLKVAEKGLTIAFMMNKLAMIISFEIILEK